MALVVLDTNVLVAALLRGGGSPRRVLRAWVLEAYRPVLGPALLVEYEDVLARSEPLADSVLTAKERGGLFDGSLSRIASTSCVAPKPRHRHHHPSSPVITELPSLPDVYKILYTWL